MDAISVVSSASLSRSIDYIHAKQGSRRDNNNHTTTNHNNNHKGKKPTSMVQKKWATTTSASMEGGVGSGNGKAATRRPSYDICQRSEVSGTGTDLSADRPATRDTAATSLSIFARDASTLSGQPDKSDYREKMQSWAVYEDPTATGSPYLAPRPTTSLADQKPAMVGGPGGPLGALMTDVDREMSFLLSRPSTTATFPSKPKELVEPLEGIMPEERPVSQKKFLVLPSIGRHRHQRDFLLRRQRSNLETVNQLDYSRSELDEGVHFFSDYVYPTPSPQDLSNQYNNHHHGPRKKQQQHEKQISQQHHKRRQNHNHQNSHHRSTHQNHQHKQQQQQWYSDNDTEDEGNASDSYYEGGERVHCEPPHFVGGGGTADPRESPTKAGKVGTPMPLPPIHKLKLDRLAGLSQLEEEQAFALQSGGRSLSRHCYDVDVDDDDEDDEDDLEEFRLKTPDTFRSDSPIKTTITPPPGFR